MIRAPSAAERAARASHRASRARTLVEAGLRTPQSPKERRKRLGRREEPRRSSFFKVPDYFAHLRTLGCASCRHFGLACREPIVIHHMREGAGAGVRRPGPAPTERPAS